MIQYWPRSTVASQGGTCGFWAGSSEYQTGTVFFMQSIHHFYAFKHHRFCWLSWLQAKKTWTSVLPLLEVAPSPPVNHVSHPLNRLDEVTPEDRSWLIWFACELYWWSTIIISIFASCLVITATCFTVSHCAFAFIKYIIFMVTFILCLLWNTMKNIAIIV